MFHEGYPISLIRVLLCCYHCILRIDVMIYSAPQLQECLINLLTYLSACCSLRRIIWYSNGLWTSSILSWKLRFFSFLSNPAPKSYSQHNNMVVLPIGPAESLDIFTGVHGNGGHVVGFPI